MLNLIIMMIIVLALLHCTMNDELCNLNQFFLHVAFFTDLWHRQILMYSMSTDLLVKILFLIVAICGIVVVCMNFYINEAMRRQAAYRLAWDQRIEWDRLHIYLCSVQFYPLYAHRKTFNIWWETHESGRGSESNVCPGDGVAFTCSLWTSPLHSLNLRGCHGDFDQRKIRYLPKFLWYATTNLRCIGTGPLRNMLFVDFSYGSECYFLIFMHLHFTHKYYSL